MGKLNTGTRNVAVSSPLISAGVQDMHTHEGGVAYSRDSKSELYTLGVNYFVGEDTFYESAKDREKRFTDLVAKVAVEDPKWIHGFLWWMRSKGNIRTASILGAIVAVHARLNDPKSVADDKARSDSGKVAWNRMIVRDVCQRADEPGEFLAGWTARYGRSIPKPVKRGLADAAGRLYSEYSYMKYDSAGSAWRFGDIIEMTHAKPSAFVSGNDRERMSEDEVLDAYVSSGVRKSALYGLAIADRHGNVTPDHYASLPMITANKALRKAFLSNPEVLLNAELLKQAGFTWEDALSLAGNKIDKAKLWESIIPNMGIFALVRNLRNFEQAGISASVRKYVIEQLTNPEVIAKSRMFPFRFWAAFENTNSLHYAAALEEAIGLSVANVPLLTGDTLVLSDISASMSHKVSNKSTISYAEAAAIFAGALCLKNPDHTEFVGFADSTFVQKVAKGGSLLKLVKEFHRKAGSVGGGTETVMALERHYKPENHSRVFIVTDMQAFANHSWGYHSTNREVVDVVDDKTWLYGFSLGGYKPSMLKNSGSGRVHELSGLTDSAFQLPALLERGRDQHWPWED